MFNKKNIFYSATIIVIFFIVFSVGFSIGENQVICPVCKPEQVDFSLFWDAYNKLHENFIDPDKINDQKIIYGAISGMAKSLDDPYTDFFNPDQAKIFSQDLSGSFEGIGVEIGIKNGWLTVIAPLKETPGEEAGLKPGDQIIKIDQKNTQNMSIDESVNLIRGKKGTPVILTIFREGWNQPQDIKIVRDTIKTRTIEWELKDDNIAYIHIYQFGQSLPIDFKKIALEIVSSSAKKIVLDLRNNPGGYLEVAQEIAGWFLKSGQVVTIEDSGKGKDQKLYKAEGNAVFAKYPMVVLMNKGSASASEILAGALRDNRKIQLVGEKSFGKGSVQTVVDLADGKSILKITIAKWLTPAGNSIAEVGLDPDVKIKISDDDLKNNKDPQLQKALEIIKELK